MGIWLSKIMQNYGLNVVLSEYISSAVIILMIIVISTLAYKILKNILLKYLKKLIFKKKLKFASIVIENKVLENLSIFISAFVTYTLSSMLIHGQIWAERIAFCLIVFGIIRTLDKILNVINDVYKDTKNSKNRPIKGFLQIITIIAYAIGIVVIISILMERSPVLLLGGIGAASAVLMLIFQNTILGFVASIQLTENDMLRIGDWIEMPSHNADGDVKEISLHTVKVVNWDKTVTTIPTHTMISESYKNWRNMHEMGGRRIKRCVYIDMTTIKFCTEEMLERYRKIQYIQKYLDNKITEISNYNEQKQVDFSSLVNGRHLTNLGTLRAYLETYLKNHPRLHSEFLMIVRQLPPTEHGLPIELYGFTNTTKWVEYEAIQADIFDHVLAIIPEFDLRIYQSPTGYDFAHRDSPPVV